MSVASIVRTAGVLLGLLAATPASPQAIEHAVSHEKYPDPTSGPIVLFPGPLRSPLLTEHMRLPLGWHIAGRNFRSGDGWWALACQKSCTLTSVKLTVRALQHPTYDGPPMHGQYLTWSPLPYGLDTEPPPSEATTPPRNNAHLIALFKPIRSLASMKLPPGPVKTWLHAGMTSYPRPGTPGTMETLIRMDGSATAVVMPRMVIRSEAEKQKSGDNLDCDLVFELRAYGKRQRLGQYEWDVMGPHPLAGPDYLQWAGDLDGDGKLDLIMSFAARGTHSVIFLSSLAKPGEIVGEAGRIEYFAPNDSGC